MAPEKNLLTHTGVAVTRAVRDGVITGNFDGVILLAHGARDQRWLEPFKVLRSSLEDKLRPCVVALSFMEFAPPSFADVAKVLCTDGARNILVIPVFLSGGGHVASDVPVLVQAERERYPLVHFDVAGAIGEQPEVSAAMAAAITRLSTK